MTYLASTLPSSALSPSLLPVSTLFMLILHASFLQNYGRSISYSGQDSEYAYDAFLFCLTEDENMDPPPGDSVL